LNSRQVIYRLINNWPAKILSLIAAIVLFLFFRISNLEERYFSIPLEVRVSDGYVVTSSYPKRIRVTLRGDANEIFQILEEDLNAYIDLAEHSVEGVYRKSVVIQTRGTAANIESLELEIEPKQITVEIQKKIVRSFAVKPRVSGFPASGYELYDYYVTPDSVEVSGPRSVVQNIDNVYTEEIDLSGRTDDFSVRVSLVKPDSRISFQESDMVEYHGKIQEMKILKTYQAVNIVTLDLDPELSISNNLPKGTIKIQAPQNTLSQINSQDIAMVVDCSGINVPGNYVLPVNPDVPKDFLVLQYTPREIELEIEYQQQGGEE